MGCAAQDGRGLKSHDPCFACTACGAQFRSKRQADAHLNGPCVQVCDPSSDLGKVMQSKDKRIQELTKELECFKAIGRKRLREEPCEELPGCEPSEVCKPGTPTADAETQKKTPIKVVHIIIKSRVWSEGSAKPDKGVHEVHQSPLKTNSTSPPSLKADGVVACHTDAHGNAPCGQEVALAQPEKSMLTSTPIEDVAVLRVIEWHRSLIKNTCVTAGAKLIVQLFGLTQKEHEGKIGVIVQGTTPTSDDSRITVNIMPEVHSSRSKCSTMRLKCTKAGRFLSVRISNIRPIALEGKTLTDDDIKDVGATVAMACTCEGAWVHTENLVQFLATDNHARARVDSLKAQLQLQWSDRKRHRSLPRIDREKFHPDKLSAYIHWAQHRGWVNEKCATRMIQVLNDNFHRVNTRTIIG